MKTSEAKLGVVCAALVTGVSLGLLSGGMAAAWPFAGIITLFSAVFGFALKWKPWPALFFFLLGLTQAMRAADERYKVWTEVELRNGYLAGTFEVQGDPRAGRVDLDGMRSVSFPTEFAGGKLRVVFRQSVTNAPPRVGEKWRCAGWVDRKKGSLYRARCVWVRGRGTFAECAHAAKTHAVSVFLARMKREVSRRLGIGLKDAPLVADLNRAMVLGERAALPYEMRQNFIHSGTMHVFAISGLHVMVVAKVLLYLIVVMAFPVRWAGVVLTPVLWLYVLMIGAPSSAIRAAAMASVYYAAPIFWCRPNSLTAWEVTLFGFALLDPIGFFGVGSLLSFTVMLGILLFLRWAKPFESVTLEWLGTPLAAWLAGMPIAAHVFSRITPGGLLANLAMVPLACASVLTSVLGVAASFLSERLAAHVNNLAALFTETMAGISWVVSQIPGADIPIAPWSIPLCLTCYAGFVLLFVWVKMVWFRRRHSLT